MEPIDLEGSNKELKIMYKGKTINQIAKKSLKQEAHQAEQDISDIEGMSTTCRKIISGIHIDTNTSMADFPYNYNDVKLKLEFEAKMITIQ